MSKKLFEAGILKVILDGTLDYDSETIVVNSIDSYKYPFNDFFEEASNLLKPLENQSLINIKLFIVMGPLEKIEVIKRQWDTKIQNFFDDILIDVTYSNKFNIESTKPIFPSIDLLNDLYISNLIDQDVLFYPQCVILQNNDLAMMVSYRSKDPGLDSYKDVEQVLDIWIDKEAPYLRGFQVFTRPFILNKMRGRKIITTLPDPNDSNWAFLLEGGIVFPINDSFENGILKLNSSHIGRWTIGEIEEIMLNPVYFLGRHYEPYDVFLDWQYVFLYAIVSLNLDNEYDDNLLFQIYKDKFLDFVEEHICEYILAETLMDIHEGREIFFRVILQIKRYLIGEEETGISKNILLLMRSRYCYLPYIYTILSESLPNIEERLITTTFKNEIWFNLMHQLTTITNSYEKGIILEEVASYFIDTIKGFKITARRKRGEREEIDIYFCNVSLDSRLWELGALALVECKNHKKKSTVSDIRNLIPVMDTKGIKSAIMFSTSGFTRDAQQEIENQYLRGKLIITVQLKELQELSEINTPYKFIVNKVGKIMKDYEDDLRLAY